MPPFRAFAVAAALSALTGCSVAAAPQTTSSTAAVVIPRCEETTASPASSRPPALAGTTSAWFGTGDLWAGLPDYEPTVQGDALVLKFPWVTFAEGAPSAQPGPPAIRAVRSDPPGEVTGTVGDFARGFGNGGLGFWPATVELPGPGCWTISGTLGATTVDVVVDVAAPD